MSNYWNSEEIQKILLQTRKKKDVEKKKKKSGFEVYIPPHQRTITISNDKSQNDIIGKYVNLDVLNKKENPKVKPNISAIKRLLVREMKTNQHQEERERKQRKERIDKLMTKKRKRDEDDEEKEKNKDPNEDKIQFNRRKRQKTTRFDKTVIKTNEEKGSREKKNTNRANKMLSLIQKNINNSKRDG